MISLTTFCAVSDGRTPRGVRGLKFIYTIYTYLLIYSRTPRGVRGLKFINWDIYRGGGGRTPRGVRGLKSLLENGVFRGYVSHPSRGAWIEICRSIKFDSASSSHPSRGAWIEIIVLFQQEHPYAVAPLAGCVD